MKSNARSRVPEICLQVAPRPVVLLCSRQVHRDLVAGYPQAVVGTPGTSVAYLGQLEVVQPGGVVCCLDCVDWQSREDRTFLLQVMADASLILPEKAEQRDAVLLLLELLAASAVARGTPVMLASFLRVAELSQDELDIRLECFLRHSDEHVRHATEAFLNLPLPLRAHARRRVRRILLLLTEYELTGMWLALLMSESPADPIGHNRSCHLVYPDAGAGEPELFAASLGLACMLLALSRSGLSAMTLAVEGALHEALPPPLQSFVSRLCSTSSAVEVF